MHLCTYPIYVCIPTKFSKCSQPRKKTVGINGRLELPLYPDNPSRSDLFAPGIHFLASTISLLGAFRGPNLLVCPSPHTVPRPKRLLVAFQDCEVLLRYVRPQSFRPDKFILEVYSCSGLVSVLLQKYPIISYAVIDH